MVRNKYAHELTNVIFEGVTESEIMLLFDMYLLHRKVSQWFFVEIEAPAAGIDLHEVDLEDVQSTGDVIFGMILNILYSGKSEEYKAMVTAIKEGGQL